ncbi:hypothetical protein BLNAU_9943 [Blattamonas nauphoetae]|uniref:Uncharacterized protein n=1 Tax=Blattamonas nauphoetae TaxID=2049346 RepID=A0ABQ9XU57_9EUKA|nr:hypothetical protein BLNAU_9943 [Blattamonas nauphoetae]
MVATLSFSFAPAFALLLCGSQCVDQSMDGDDWWEIVIDELGFQKPFVSLSTFRDSLAHQLTLPQTIRKESEDLIADFIAVLDPCSIAIHTLPLPSASASPSPPTPSHSPLPLPHHPHPPTPLYLSLTSLGVVHADRRFSSLSPTIPQLMTSCPVTRPKANPNRARGKDEIAVG